MVGPCACQSFCRNLPSISKDKLAGAPQEPAFTNNTKTPTYISTMSHISTPTLAFFPTPANSTARYSEENFQQIFKTVLGAEASAPALRLLVLPHGPCERSLKVRFLNLYCGKTYIKCYNFYQ